MTTAPLRRATAWILAPLLAAAPLAGQGDKPPKWRVDPYTKHEPEAMQKAGIVSFGPFRFGNLADKSIQNTDIDKAIEFAQILWLETPHFRIGTNLPAWPVPTDPETRNKVRGELTELATKLPGVNPKTRSLDPWLRAHLTAFRMEKLYAETCALFGVEDKDFPKDAAEVVVQEGARYMGYGPYLGMRDKYLVLVFEKQGPFLQYMKQFLGRDSKHPQRHHFVESGSLLFTMPTESNEFPRKHDTATHCALAFNVSQNLLDGFRHYGYDLPVWLREGWSHWNGRRVDPKWNNFDQNEGSLADMKTTWRWEVYCRGLVGSSGKFAPFPEALKWRDFGNIGFDDHVAVWSRVDWLLSQGPEKWRKFLFAVKGRVDPKTWAPDHADLVGATRQALQDAYGISVLQFDEKWIEWVKATYPSQ
ncbi:MAG: hypothetical protein KF830_03325 [Planctomycetes bacterium]|nr:hypothetical protein [Planctomycetota bacterium]